MEASNLPPASTTKEEDTTPQNRGWAAPTPFDYARFQAEAEAPGTTQYAFSGARYEWREEFGDVCPRVPELEAVLFDNTGRTVTGQQFARIQNIRVDQEGDNRIAPVRTFADAGLHPVMLENIELAGYNATGPTPVQAYCLPAIAQNRDVLACAQTGSGKTGAYIIPIISKLMGKAKKWAAPKPRGSERARAEPLFVIIAPTRELAMQIFDEARRFSYRSMLRPCVVYGGGPKNLQREELFRGCDILIGTVGRLVDFLEEPSTISMRRVRYMVIDEADEMLGDGWSEQMNRIMQGGDIKEGQVNYMMFSATFPTAVRNLAREHLAPDHCVIRVGRAGSTHTGIKQEVVWVDEDLKRTALYDRLMTWTPGRAIIFTKNIRICEEVDDFLYHKGVPCTSLHSRRVQVEREDAMRAFRSAKCPVLVATDIAARGLDVANVQYIVNYDLPALDQGGIEEYTHRIGRTGRIGNTGLACSFYNDNNEDLAQLLTMTLLETDQTIPEFLQSYVPEGGRANLDFEAAANGTVGFDDADDDAAGGDAWGASGNASIDASTNAPTSTSAGDSWGASAAPTSSTTAAAPASANISSGDGWDASTPPAVSAPALNTSNSGWGVASEAVTAGGEGWGTGGSSGW